MHKTDKNTKSSVLVVDDEEAARRSLTICLRREEYDVEAVASLDEALRALERR